jgi:hypothetical protein
MPINNEAIIYNIFVLSGFFLSSISMFILSFYLTQRWETAFISGLTYGFCPYIFNHAWEHLGLAHIEWMPLYILMLLMLYNKPNYKFAILASFAFSLVINFNGYYAYIISIFTLGFLSFIILYNWKIKLIVSNYELRIYNWKIIRMIMLVFCLTMVISSVSIYPIFKTFFLTKTNENIAALGYVRSFSYLFSQSARPLSYLLPSAAHPIFGNFTKTMFGSIFYGRNSIEQTLYLGWTPLIFAFIAFRVWRKRRKNKQLTVNREQSTKDNFYIGLFIFSAIFAFLFSMPPYANLGIFKIYFPSFFLYKVLPMFRACARFGILVMLCVSVLAGFGLKYILERIKTHQKRFAFTTLITCLILFEFTNIPPFRTFDISKSPEVYIWLSKQKGDFAIVEYPLGETVGPGEADMPYDYLFYQRVHQKKLINGAKIGTYAYKIKQKINKIMSPETPGILKWLGAKYTIIHLDKYKTSEDSEAMEIIGEVPDLRKQVGLKFVKKFDDVEVYEVVAIPIEPKIN